MSSESREKDLTLHGTTVFDRILETGGSVYSQRPSDALGVYVGRVLPQLSRHHAIPNPRFYKLRRTNWEKPHITSGQTSEDSSVVDSTKSGMSNSTAKFHELDRALKRQQADADIRDKNLSERLHQIERQFSRFEDIDKKLDDVQQSVSGQLSNFKEQILQSLSTAPSTSDTAIHLLEQQVASLMTLVNRIAETTIPSSSPEPTYSTPCRRKKAKSGNKRSIQSDRNITAIVTNRLKPENTSQQDFDSTRDLSSDMNYEEIKTDLESRYNANTSPRRVEES